MKLAIRSKTIAAVVVCVLNSRSASAVKCLDSNDDLLAYQREILKSVDSPRLNDTDWLSRVSHPFGCLLAAQENLTGLAKYYAGSLLRPLLGNPQIDGMRVDARFARVAQRLEKLTLKSNDIVKESVVTLFAKGEWGFVYPCGERADCPIFYPEEKQIQKQAPIVAAASLIHLKKAYGMLQGREKQKVAMMIKNLYQSIPKDSPIQRRVIEQIYSELFEPSVHLS